MPSENKTVVSVNDLVIGVKNDESTEGDYRFKIEYGTFDIKAGDFVLVKGRNGCGKSTFLRMFHLQSVNYFKVLSGGIRFVDEAFPDKSIHQYSSEELTRLNCAVSFIGQEDVFLTSDSAYSYIYNSCKLSLLGNASLTPADRRARLVEADKLIAECYDKYLAASFQCKNYKTFKNKNVRGWSGGQQKMINVLAGIIKAKVCGLRLIVMDEPLNNLDGRNKDILNSLVADLRNNDIAIIAITHCQIFGGVNKVLTLVEEDDGVRRAYFEVRQEPAHFECLESFH